MPAATNEAAAMQCTSNGVVRKSKNISLDCVSTCFGGVDFSVTDRSCFKNDRKNLSQFVHNAIFNHSKIFQNGKMTENFSGILEK